MAETILDKVDVKGNPEHPLDKEKKSDVADLQNRIYTEDDKDYLSFLQLRLENAKRFKEQVHPEFDNKTIHQYYNENEHIANTQHVTGKKNDDDVIISAGTVEQKLDALLSNINNLNLGSDVHAYDKENNRVSALGKALGDIIHDTKIRDGGDGGGDEEKRLARQRELLKQGTVFVQEEWMRKFETKKVLNGRPNGKFNKAEANTWSEKLELVFEGPSRTLLYGPNVYLGDITEFYMENQPYVFTVTLQDYDVAKARFGKFENWKYVERGKVPADTQADTPKTIYDNKWRLTDLKKNQVEIVLYQDKPRDEFQVIINGVLMMPIGFPLSSVSPRGEYNIAKQVYRIIHDKFAYGGSFVSSGSVKEVSAMIDEMLKLFILKTRKSITPAYVNTSGRVIDRKVLSPGRISMGIDAGSLQPIASNETQGITAGEVQHLQNLQNLISQSTVSDTFTGQPGVRGQTATEVLETQRQAKLTLSLTVSVCALLEKKLDYLRLYNILENWFEPTGTKVKELQGARKLIKTYRKTNREVNLEGEGLGERKVVPTDEDLPKSKVIRGLERQEENERGFPVKKIYINPTKLRSANLHWYLEVNPQEKESSPFFKLMFREMLTDMIGLINLGSVPNKEGLEEEFSRVWNKPTAKLFQKSVSPDIAGVSAAAGPGRGGEKGGVPSLPAEAGGGIPAGVAAGASG